jgi:hypothetical protein
VLTNLDIVVHVIEGFYLYDQCNDPERKMTHLP